MKLKNRLDGKTEMWPFKIWEQICEGFRMKGAWSLKQLHQRAWQHTEIKSVFTPTGRLT